MVSKTLSQTPKYSDVNNDYFIQSPVLGENSS